MVQTILVPLDGSPLSERALPLAAQIARRAGANLRLATVLAPFAAPPLPAAAAHDEQATLKTAAWRVQRAAPGSTVQTSLLNGPVAATLAEHALEVKADLIVLTTHGRGAFSRFWLGSVADELIRRAAVPVLVLRPTDLGPADFDVEVPVRRIVVPLDGSDAAASALELAAQFAQLYGAPLHLFSAVAPPPPAVGPEGMAYLPVTADADLLGQLTVRAEAALESVGAPWRARGLTVTTRAVVHDAAATAILDESGPGDLIALATHGRRGPTRWLLGSVADKVIRAAEVPVLVTRPNGKPLNGPKPEVIP